MANPSDEQLLRMYGKVPTKSDILNRKLQDRKYFDSGDYALSQAGRATAAGVPSVGSKHPNPESIPRGGNSPSNSPVKRA
uniref:mRNA stability protein n=1 Tax=Blastobotrys adeninivorans TaxID=409370 RepID=A0A060T0Q3_BLAAD